MKKILYMFLAIILAFSIPIMVFATDSDFTNEPYTFSVDYEGDIIVGQEKEADISLIGVNAPTYTNVLIKFNISGPSVPQLIAYDSAGTRYDLAQLGSWGPPTGFAVQGTFTNVTPVTALFDTAGTYEISVSLVDLANNENIITQRVFNFNVLAETPPAEDTNTTTNVLTNTNEITEMPKTGTSISEYMVYILTTIAIISIGYIMIRKNKYEN